MTQTAQQSHWRRLVALLRRNRIRSATRQLHPRADLDLALRHLIDDEVVSEASPDEGRAGTNTTQSFHDINRSIRSDHNE